MNELAKDDSDPFHWAPQRLAQELCSPNQPWFSTDPRKFPSFDALSKGLQENDVDGEAFLTWDTVASLHELFSSIAINRIHHRLNLHKAVTTLKNRSPAYQRWKLEENSGDSADIAAPYRYAAPASSMVSTAASDLPPLQASNGDPCTSPRARVNSALSKGAAKGDTRSGQREPISHSTPGDVDTEPAGANSLLPPAKKRRVVPLVVSSDTVVRSGLFHVPTEADAIEKRFGRTQRERQQPLNAGGNQAATYLGPKAILYEDIISNLPSAVPTADDSFSFIDDSTLSLGHRMRIHSAMKAILNGNKRKVELMLDTFDAPIDPESLLANIVDSGKDRGLHLGDDDSVFAPFGQEPGDDEVDPQTVREMEEEAADIEREERRRRTLTKDEVNEEIDDAITTMVNDWSDRKLPGLKRKAHRIWTQARQDRSLRPQLRFSTDFLERLKDRIAKARQEIVNNSWTTPQAVLRQAKSLEPSVFDRERHSWLIKTLNGPMPPKLAPTPRSPKAKWKPRFDEEDEVLTSESDDTMDDFIVDDEGRGVEEASDDEMIDVQHAMATPAARHGLVKTDPSPEPPFEFRGRNFVDLTIENSPEPDILPRPSRSPTGWVGDTDDKPAESDIETVSEHLDESIEAGSQKRKSTYVPDSVWQSIPTDIELDDDERRLIERFWRIGKVARDEVYKAAKDCEADTTRFWDIQIMKGLQSKTPIGNTSAMIARLFLYYAQPSTTFHELVFKKVRRKDRHKVICKKDCASRFLTLILRVMPTLPATVELSGEDGEITQVTVDSRALNLRQQDQERIAEQERRRAELRGKLALVASIPKDESRLIVNETKEEDEGLIYIHGDPARLIKDHQIDGVRFLWNRVIANRGVVRHGCVLAHSMGLGKSMQVITFLLAVVHASKSADASIRSQLPKDLRVSRTLILAPASLLQNWRDELFTWDSGQELGQVYTLASSQKNLAAAQNKAFRQDDVCKWAKYGGVLILGYELFVSFTTHSPDLAEIISSKAAIVIADEAHTIKNPFSKRRRACAKVSTPARIALTGSPLSNNVTEYYSMVDWVAPQYMGSLEEFTNVYATPIQNGLYKDPDPAMKRKAQLLLRVVRDSMAPKVHRCGISILREELKVQKQEFMFFLPMTDIQRKIYDAYVDNIGLTGRANIWGALGNLTLVCMHPQCFKAKVDAVLQEHNRGSNHTMDRDNEAQKQHAAYAKTAGDITMPYEVAVKLDQLLSSIEGISDINHSWRFRLLFPILDECRAAGDKVLIFSRRQITLNFLQKIFRQQGRSSLRLDGQTPMPQRLGMIKTFNSKDSGTEIFLISTKAGGVGLNIHGANRVIIMDFEHNPMDEQQAIGRAYRIGQDKPVFVYWFVSWGTHEAKLQSRLVYKKQLADRVVEGKDYKPWAAEDNFETWVQNVWDSSPQRPLPPSEAGSLGGADRVVERLITDPELVQGIKSVVTTDTFEVEEDPEDIKLTEEEENERRYRLHQEAQRRNEEPTGSPPPPPVTPAPPVAEMPKIASWPQSTQEIDRLTNQLREKHADPEHLSMALRRQTASGGRSRIKRMDDEIALREIADRRQRMRAQMKQQEAMNQTRQDAYIDPALPTWANDAVRRSQG